MTREKERYGAVDMAELLDRVFVETDQELVGEKGINSGCTAVVSVLLRGKGAQVSHCRIMVPIDSIAHTIHGQCR